MTDSRFWKIVDAFESCTDSIEGLDVQITDQRGAIANIVYYDHGQQALSEADTRLLYRDEYPDNTMAVVKSMCEEYKNLGKKEFKKLYGNSLISYKD